MQILMILIMALSAFMLGGLWYSKLMFLNAWTTDSGVHPDVNKGHEARVFGIAFIHSLIAAAAFAHFIGVQGDVALSMVKGVTVGLLFVATSYGVNYQFANRPLRMWLIDAGYHTVKFALYGLVMGLWPK